jgi:hypothetical protein
MIMPAKPGRQIVQADTDVLDTPVVKTNEGHDVHDVAPAEDE